MPGKYDDIIDLPWPQPQPRDPMPRAERAAQFSPFAALTGFEALIAETEQKASENGEQGAENREQGP